MRQPIPHPRPSRPRFIVKEIGEFFIQGETGNRSSAGCYRRRKLGVMYGESGQRQDVRGARHGRLGCHWAGDWRGLKTAQGRVVYICARGCPMASGTALKAYSRQF